MFKAMLKTTAMAAVALMALMAPQAEAGNRGPHDEPIVGTKQFDLTVPRGEYRWVKVLLKKSTRYEITAEHNPQSVYPQVFPPPPDDVKLRVKRYWKGHLKMDKHVTGLGRATMKFRSVHYGHRYYFIKVYNLRGRKHQGFRVTIRSH